MQDRKVERVTTHYLVLVVVPRVPVVPPGVVVLRLNRHPACLGVLDTLCGPLVPPILVPGPRPEKQRFQDDWSTNKK